MVPFWSFYSYVTFSWLLENVNYLILKIYNDIGFKMISTTLYSFHSHPKFQNHLICKFFWHFYQQMLLAMSKMEIYMCYLDIWFWRIVSAANFIRTVDNLKGFVSSACNCEFFTNFFLPIQCKRMVLNRKLWNPISCLSLVHG